MVRKNSAARALPAALVLALLGIGQLVLATPAADARERAAPDSSLSSSGPGPAGPGPSVSRTTNDLPAGYARIAGHLLPILPKARLARVGFKDLLSVRARGTETQLLTIVLRRDDEPAFQRYLRDVADPGSPDYHHFLNVNEQAERFGPSAAHYDALVHYFEDRHLAIALTSTDRLTLTLRGSRQHIEDAFKVAIRDYEIDGQRFYANDRDPALPADLAASIQSVSGLSEVSRPHHAAALIFFICAGLVLLFFLATVASTAGFAAAPSFALFGVGLGVCAALVSATNPDRPKLIPVPITRIYTQPPVPFTPYYGPNPYNNPGTLPYGGFPQYTKRQHVQPLPQVHASGSGSQVPLDGAGQTIALVEFAQYSRSDVVDYLALVGLPASNINNLSDVAVAGGATTTADADEVLLDIDAVMTIAPAAKVVVYTAPFDGRAASYATVFNAIIGSGATVASNSWTSCEDEVSLADAQGIDSVLQAAAVAGVSVFNGTGDAGSTCLDGSPKTIGVPSDSPHATAVGGSSLTLGDGFTYKSESWWDGSLQVPPTGQGGFGVSRYFPRPSYQDGINAAAMRSVPDVVVNADPSTAGLMICQASNGGCPSGRLYGGTSLAAPEWAAFTALLNTVHGPNASIGAFNPLLYPVAATAAFHNAASMHSDFAHVGLGSPNIDQLYLALTGTAPGAVDTTTSSVVPLVDFTALLPSTSGVPADGTTQGGILVVLRDSNHHSLANKTVSVTATGAPVTITPSSATTSINDGSAVFHVTGSVPGTANFVVTDVTDGVTLPTASLTFFVPAATSAGLNVAPATVAADGQSSATITVTLKDGRGLPTPGKSVSIRDGQAHAVITGPASGVTDANGQIQFQATDQVNETVTFTAVDVTDGNLPVPGSGVVTFSGSVSSACNIGVVPVAGPGYQITRLVTGIPAAANLFYGNINFGCPGAVNPAFPPQGSMLIADYLTGAIYREPITGGTATSADVITQLSPTTAGLVFGKDGSLYATQSTTGGNFTTGDVVQLDPATGKVLRTIAAGLTCPAGLAVDPLSGDLFFDDDCFGAGSNNPAIFRIIDPAGTDASRPTSVVTYATLPVTPNAGMAFAPNGDLYVVGGYGGGANGAVYKVSGTAAAAVSVTLVPGIQSDFPIAVGATNADGSARTLLVEPSGVLTETPLSNPAGAVVIASKSPGLGTVGPDGCLYSASYDTIYRLATSSGGCSYARTSPAPAIALAPAAVAGNPAQGSAQSFTATLSNVATPAGTAVSFKVRGANPQTALVRANSAGAATLTYTSIFPGTDTLSASAVVNGTGVTSNTATVTWAAGAHTTFLTLNLSAKGGVVGKTVPLVATLVDVSTSPLVPVAGKTVTFTAGTVTCSAVTAADGSASCPITVTGSGDQMLQAGFAGTAGLLPATAETSFHAHAVPGLPPAVTVTVSPTTVAAGSPVAVTWSSTDASSCVASGAWSGAQPTSGTTSVSPTAAGAYTYGLTCSGAGGSTTATATLTVTLERVDVTAKSGGGAFGGTELSIMSLLAAWRLRRRIRRGSGLIALACATFAGVPAAPAKAQTVAASPAEAHDWYVGLRAGGLRESLDSQRLTRALVADGYPATTAAVAGSSALAGSLYAGYAFTPALALEASYTHRDSATATVNTSIPAAVALPKLLGDVAHRLRGYTDLVALEGRWEIPLSDRWVLDPRLGAYWGQSKATATAGSLQVSETDRTAGPTAGVGVAYRISKQWRVGVGADYYRASASQYGWLYAGALEWRFASR